MNRDDRIYVAGHQGLVGSAITRYLRWQGHRKLLLVPRQRLDLRDAARVYDFFDRSRPTHVFLAAAAVGGIVANQTTPADFLFDNLKIQTNVIDAAHRYGCAKMLFLGSSCIYPKDAAQPIAESALLTGPLEDTNRAYAIAKIAGVEMLNAYRTQHGLASVAVMPCNLYGRNDNFHPQRSHVIPGMMRAMHEAKIHHRATVDLWGSGRPRREFLHVDDLAEAAVFLMRTYEGAAPVNVGAGADLSIAELALLMADVVGFDGVCTFNPSMPDGVAGKLLDVSAITALGWRPSIGLDRGLELTYRWFVETWSHGRLREQ